MKEYETRPKANFNQSEEKKGIKKKKGKRNKKRKKQNKQKKEKKRKKYNTPTYPFGLSSQMIDKLINKFTDKQINESGLFLP